MTNTRAPIFDTFERTDPAPARHREPTSEFLGRVAGAFWDHVRQLMQTWADHITNIAEYNDLCQRIRLGEDEQFRSAFLELYLHECLLLADYTVTVHPHTPTGSRRPDFYAERDGTGFYLEAIAPGSSPDAKGANARRAVLFDIVNELGDPNFFLWLSSLTEGPNPPSSARLRNGLRKWLAGLDPDDYPDFGVAPEWHWEHSGWAATFKAIPKKAEARGTRPTDRAIGVYAYAGVSRVDDAPMIRDGLAAKHNAYGDLNAPFVIAIGTYIFDSDRWHSTNAFYGHEAIQFSATVGDETTQVIREPDGYFGVFPDWQHRNVSAVLLINQLMPYHLLQAETTLWQHPDPLHPLPESHSFPWATVKFDGTQLIGITAPVTASDFFGLPEDWPPGEPWPKPVAN
ncbi:hypothetical protein [Nocardia suismassiliense]|uniref:hypothetical protein n=1 Tax=Nocardia suismassiliense TaxID=2077092 RepID=UPI00131F4123|nr:hypothetical protein [Nocardia suismassiliense]